MKDLHDECMSIVGDIRNEWVFADAVNILYARIYAVESQRDRLLAVVKTAVNQLEHVVPTVDPTMDSNEIYTTFDAVISRCNHTKNVLIDVIREIEGGR